MASIASLNMPDIISIWKINSCKLWIGGRRYLEITCQVTAYDNDRHALNMREKGVDVSPFYDRATELSNFY